MWSIARTALGLTDAEFWDLTPREFHALSEAHREQERMRNYRAGLIAAAVYNVNRTKEGQHFFQPLEFFETAKAEIEYDIDKLVQGVEYTLRMCEASLIKD